MKIKLSLLIYLSILLISCGHAGKETEHVEEVKTDEIISDSTASAEKIHVPVVEPYLNKLEYGKIKFSISSPQSANANTFTVAPSGFTISNDTLTMDCEGIIIKTEVGELDGDNAPELLIVTQTGPNKKGMAYIFSANQNKSMSMVHLPDFTIDPKNNAGYDGQDEFALVENSFSHRFPLYENGTPNNKTRQFQYKLKRGEAMKKLVLIKTIEY